MTVKKGGLDLSEGGLGWGRSLARGYWVLVAKGTWGNWEGAFWVFPNL